MRILAIDTATQVCGVALSDGKHLVAEFRLNRKNVHNERLAPAVHNLVRDADWNMVDLQGIAVSIGPGSFTGLRIGLAVAKSLAYTLEIPIVAVNTLDVLAHGVFVTDRDIAVVIKARIGEVYFARYRQEGIKIVRLTDYFILKNEELADLMRDALVITNPHGLVTENRSWQLAPENYCLSRPVIVAAQGNEKLAAGDIEDVAELEPFYLKDFVPKKKS